MIPQKYEKPIFIGTLIISTSMLIASFVLLFKAGCTADLKVGTLGNPSAALDLEWKAVQVFFLSCMFGAMSLSARKSWYSKNKLLKTILFIVVFILLWPIGMFIESSWLTYCF